MAHGVFFPALLLVLLLAPAAHAWEASTRLGLDPQGNATRFGWRAVFSGDALTLAASAQETVQDSPKAGRVYIYTRQSSAHVAWNGPQVLQSPNPSTNGSFGSDLVFSSTGDVLAVGEKNETARGRVHIFYRTVDGYELRQSLEAPVPSPTDLFGAALSMSGSGDTLAVGSPGRSSLMGPGSGAVYVFSKRNLAKYMLTSSLTTRKAKALFGAAVSVVDDDLVAIGAPGEDLLPQDGTPLFQHAGSVHLYSVGLNGTTHFLTTLRAQNPTEELWFGSSVSLSASTLVIGAFGEQTRATGVNPTTAQAGGALRSGAVYAYRRNTANTTSWELEAFVKASNSNAGDQFGQYVSLSQSGQTFIVGARFESSGGQDVNPPQTGRTIGSGAAYVFEWDFSQQEWQESTFLKSSAPQAQARFGSFVSISGDGSTLAACAAEEDTSVIDGGAVYIFNRDPPTLTAPPTPILTVTPSPTASPTISPTTASPTAGPPRASVASTTLSPSNAPTVAPDQTFTGGSVINGTATVTAPIQVVGGVLTVDGDLNLEMGSNVTLTDSSIVSTGAVVVSGPLVLQLDKVPVDGDVIQLVAGSSVVGTFSDISLQADGLRDCQKVILMQQNVQGNSLSVVASVDDVDCSLNPGIIAGIAVGAVLVALIVVLLIVAYHRKKKQSFTKDMNAEIRERDLVELKNAQR